MIQVGGSGGVLLLVPMSSSTITATYSQLADDADETARRAGSANLLLFQADGTIEARSTDGLGLLGAVAEQARQLGLRCDASQVLILTG